MNRTKHAQNKKKTPQVPWRKQHGIYIIPDQMTYCQELGLLARGGAAMIAHLEYKTRCMENATAGGTRALEIGDKIAVAYSLRDLERDLIIISRRSLLKVIGFLKERKVLQTFTHKDYGLATLFIFNPEPLIEFANEMKAKMKKANQEEIRKMALEELTEIPAPVHRSSGTGATPKKASKKKGTECTQPQKMGTGPQKTGTGPQKMGTGALIITDNTDYTDKTDYSTAQAQPEKPKPKKKPAKKPRKKKEPDQYSHRYQCRLIYEDFHHQLNGFDEYGQENTRYTPYSWAGGRDYKFMDTIENKMRGSMSAKSKSTGNPKEPADFTEEEYRMALTKFLELFLQNGSDFKKTNYSTPGMIAGRYNEILIEITKPSNNGQAPQTDFTASSLDRWGF